jgi:hypothetical protein
MRVGAIHVARMKLARLSADTLVLVIEANICIKIEIKKKTFLFDLLALKKTQHLRNNTLSCAHL